MFHHCSTGSKTLLSNGPGRGTLRPSSLSKMEAAKARPESNKCRSPQVWALRHVKGDLFSCPAQDALAHCISADCRMGAGIAVHFKRKFNGVEELKAQKKTPGECAVLLRKERFVYYLVTKQKAYHKPTYDNLRRSLEAMKTHCLKNGVTSISMPRIGCGLDRLSWQEVSVMIKDVFKDTSVHVTVYTL